MHRFTNAAGLFTATLLAGTLLAVPAPALASANLVANGGFETGSFAGWTESNTIAAIAVKGTVNGIAPFQGADQADFGPTKTLVNLYQNLHTKRGAGYFVSFALAYAGGAVGEFDVHFGSRLLLSLVNPAPFAYTIETFRVTAPTQRSVLKFTSHKDKSDFLLDAVSVSAVPEPSAWVAMIGGMGLVGAALRRRRSLAVAYA